MLFCWLFSPQLETATSKTHLAARLNYSRTRRKTKKKFSSLATSASLCDASSLLSSKPSHLISTCSSGCFFAYAFLELRVVLTYLYCRVRVPEARAQGVPQVQELVGQEEAVVPVTQIRQVSSFRKSSAVECVYLPGVVPGALCLHPDGPAVQEPLQLVVARGGRRRRGRLGGGRAGGGRIGGGGGPAADQPWGLLGQLQAPGRVPARPDAHWGRRLPKK